MNMLHQPIASSSRSATSIFRRCWSSTSRRAAEKAPEAGRSRLREVLAAATEKAAKSPAAAEAAAQGPPGRQFGGLRGAQAGAVQTNPLPFRANQMYRPHDLLKSSLYPTERPPARPPLLGPSKADAIRSDPFHILGINPLDEAINDELVRRYISQMGKIKTRAETALTWKNQRRVGKMVRRARAMGLISRWTNAAPGQRPRA